MTRRRLIVAVAGFAVASVLSFGAGRYTAPAPAVRDERTVATTTRATAAVVAKIDEARHETATNDTDTTEHVVTRWLPAAPGVGGCPAIPAHVEQEVTRETHAAATRTADARRAQQVQQHAEQQAQQTVVELHTVTAAPRPAWSVAMLAGGQLGGRRLVDALPSPLVVGVALDRRLAGPVSAGLWATSGMAGGISIRVDW